MAAKQKSAHQPPDLLSLCLAITEHAPLRMAPVEGANHIVRCVNPAFCRLLDKPSEQLVGIPFCEMLPERDECVTLLDRVFRTGKPESHTEQQHSKPHPVFWSYTMWPVLADERPVGVMIQVTETAQFHENTLAMNEALMLGSLRQHELTEVADSLNVQLQSEITERKLVEAEQKKLDQRLRDQQFYTRSLIESNIDALMTTDPSGIITDVNKQMEALTGCTRDELIGAPFKNYFTNPDRAEAAIKQVLNEKKVTDYELTASARDGKKTVVSYNATTFYDRDRKLQGVFAAARDVTERKRFEVALQETNVGLESAKSAAEKANLAKSDFLSSMSHELRSPLNAILGFAQLLESTSPLPTASQKENIAQILQAGWHLLKLINEILDLAVVESGKMLLSPEPVALAEVISECQAMMEPQAKKRNINMTFPQLDIPYYVHADRTRLKQVLINLLSNAIKYNRVQGTVEVKCTATSPERIRISVKDTGAGFPAGKLAQLFQPFNRLGQESRAKEGTGIGLVMSKRVVELMEGSIGVESTVGVGSVFWIELLLTSAPTFAVASAESTIAVHARVPTGARLRTLLYVEDNPANLTLVEQLIARRSDIRLLTAV